MTLLERLENAAEGSRELDAEIALAMGDDFTMRGSMHSHWPEKYTIRSGDRLSEKWPGATASMKSSLAIFMHVPEVSQSVDAALALIERKLPGACFRLHRQTPSSRTVPGEGAPYWATVGMPGEQEMAYAETPALAFCIALLRALEAPAQSNPENV